jgi:glutathione S-transferase
MAASLDAHLIGPTQPFVCGDEISIADYFGAGVLSLGEVIGLDYRAHQNVSRWFQRMKARSSWAKVRETFYAALVEPMRGGSYAAL